MGSSTSVGVRDPLRKFELGPAGCWLWTGSLNAAGYGKHGKKVAHRVVYELLVGPIPPGLQMDHLCRVRRCVNPDHLEPVTQQVNIERGEGACARNARVTHCPRGHAYADGNLYVNPQGFRRCRLCVARHQREYKKRRKELLASPS